MKLISKTSSCIRPINQFHNHAQYVQAVCLAGNTSCKVDIFLKYDRNISVIIHFKQYVRSFIQSAVFTGRVAHQPNRLYVLRMIVKLAYCWRFRSRRYLCRFNTKSRLTLKKRVYSHCNQRQLRIGDWSFKGKCARGQ